MARLIAALAVVLALAACSPPPPDPRLTDLAPAPEDWLAPAPDLPDIPACRQPERVARLACRAAYDRTVRADYVALAQRHAAIAQYLRLLRARRAKT